ncbi:DUF2267 domain-containing protein [Natronolimnohabitans sp. A-GB9]|uniref:DUF2267 domain-containing protein n=1 Tax=Natronolimnohabitans sp. A-GB9 TaxID=3069757 RepID=UPI0027B1E2C9|nr:DUF2267 domain-containing protein [Natronolimnohabitans sp. A-GB9]MDQ2050412.1 DUF2267 domain-containing protein [Natronolimnohabitans sp. A-GB9]
MWNATSSTSRFSTRRIPAGEADARNATQAVLSALGERLDETRSHHLDGQLPEEIGTHLVEGASGRRFDYDEFLERVPERTDRAEVGGPERLVEAVVGALFEHVEENEREDLRERLEELDFEEAIPESGPGTRSDSNTAGQQSSVS